MLKNAVQGMADGFIAQRPVNDSCKRCSYTSVCNYTDLGGQENKVSDRITKKDISRIAKNLREKGSVLVVVVENTVVVEKVADNDDLSNAKEKKTNLLS